MIIDKLTKLKNGKYSIIINGKSYELDEDIIVEYRLVKGAEINDEILLNALKKNDLVGYYHKAIKYALSYEKSSFEVYNYLIDKGLSETEAAKIIEEIVAKNLINDENIAINLINYYIGKSYGTNFIINKLKEKKIDKDIIHNAINNIDYERYYASLNKIYNKCKNKYSGNEYEVKMKIKKYLLSRGYTIDEILTIKGI